MEELERPPLLAEENEAGRKPPRPVLAILQNCCSARLSLRQRDRSRCRDHRKLEPTRFRPPPHQPPELHIPFGQSSFPHQVIAQISESGGRLFEGFRLDRMEQPGAIRRCRTCYRAMDGP